MTWSITQTLHGSRRVPVVLDGVFERATLRIEDVNFAFDFIGSHLGLHDGLCRQVHVQVIWLGCVLNIDTTGLDVLLVVGLLLEGVHDPELVPPF